MVISMQDSVLIDRLAEVNNDPKSFIEKNYLKLDFDLLADTDEKAELYFLMGRCYLLVGTLDLSIQLLYRALDYFEDNNKPLGTYLCYSNLGVLYREERKFQRALEKFNKAYDLSLDLEDFKFVIQSLINMTTVYTSIGNVEKAKEIINKALEYKDKIENTKLLGDLYNNYALIYMEEKAYETSLECLMTAYDVYKRLYGDTAHPSITLVLVNIGENYLLLKEYHKSEKYLLKTLKYATQSQMLYLEIESHLHLSKLYEEIGNFKLALEHYKKYNLLNDKELGEQTQQEINNLKGRLEGESKKNREEINFLKNVELKSKTNELEKTLKNLAHIGVIGQKLTASLDLQQIYEILRNSVYELMSADVFGIALYDELEGVLKYEYFEENGLPLSSLKINVRTENSLGSYCIKEHSDIYICSLYEEYSQYHLDSNFLFMGDRNNKSKSIIYARMIIENRCIGLITMQSYRIHQFSESDFEVIKALASYVAIAISNAQKKNIISEKANALEYLSYNDPLTELYNRRYFNELTMRYELENDTLPIGLIIGDMNELKFINDHYGHQLGDRYIVEVSKIVKKNADGHPVFRLGGDEFAILVERTSEPVLKSMISRILEDCRMVQIGPVPLSISLGYEIKHSRDQSLSEIFSMAESLMYNEKRKVSPMGRRR